MAHGEGHAALPFDAIVAAACFRNAASHAAHHEGDEGSASVADDGTWARDAAFCPIEVDAAGGIPGPARGGDHTAARNIFRDLYMENDSGSPMQHGEGLGAADLPIPGHAARPQGDMFRAGRLWRRASAHIALHDEDDVMAEDGPHPASDAEKELPRLVFEDRVVHRVITEDLFSSLPDDVLQLLLSRVPTVQAVQLSMLLCRRFGTLWTGLPRLLLDDSAVAAAGVTHFGQFVYGILANLEAELNLERLLIRISAIDNVNAEDIIDWVWFGTSRVTGSFILQLNLGRDIELEERLLIKLPCQSKANSISLSSSSAEDVELWLECEPGRAFDCLIRLTLSGACFTDGGLQLGHVLSLHCPCLKIFNLCDIEGVTTFRVDSKSLEKVVLSNISTIEDFDLKAPNLRDLGIRGVMGSLKAGKLKITACNLENVFWKDVCPDPATIKGTRLKRLEVYDLRKRIDDGPTTLQILFQQFPVADELILFVKVVHYLIS